MLISLTELGRWAPRARRPTDIPLSPSLSLSLYVTKSLRSMSMRMTQQDIQLSKSPGSMPTSITRRNIHNAKSSRSTAPSVPGCWHRIRSDNDDDDDLRLWYRYRTGSHDADLDQVDNSLCQMFGSESQGLILTTCMLGLKSA